MLAATSFSGGTLTIDFSTASEAVTISNDGANITVSSSDSVAGDGSTFAANTINRLVVTDSGALADQSLVISGSTDYSLSGGLKVTGAERATLDRALSTATADLSVTTNESIRINAALSATDGNILLSANQQATVAVGNFDGIMISATSVSTTGTGTVTLLGRAGKDSGSRAEGILLAAGATVSGRSTVVTGTGGENLGNLNFGVSLAGGSTITSTGGNVAVTGTSLGGGGSSTGVSVASASVITATGTGTVTVTGFGSGTGSFSNGVSVLSAGARITSTNGDVVVEGTGGFGVGGTGIALEVAGEISAGGSGTVTLQGTATSTGAGSFGVLVNGSNPVITSGGGRVKITAISNTGEGLVLGDATISSGGNADVEIISDSLWLQNTGTINSGSGRTILRTYSAGTLISIGGNDVVTGSPPLTLGLTNTELNRITAGTLLIGSSTSGNLTLSAAIAPGGINQLELVTGGQILDTNASGNDITVTRLGLTASTGIGVGNTLDTAVSNLEATTATGGIFISNTGALSIGGVNSTLAGLRVTGASGDIDLQNTSGDVRVTTSGDLVKTPGNVSIKTLTSGHIITANNNGSSSFDGSVNSTGGSVTLDAAGNLDMGETGSNNIQGDVRSHGNVVLLAGGSITVDDGATVQSPSVGSTISVTAGTDISIQSTNSGGSLIGNSSSTGGLVSIRTGAGGRFAVNGNSLNPGLLGGSGGITVAADDMSLLDDIRAFGGQVNLVAVTAGREIDLGTDTSGKLGLTNAEVRNIVTAVGLSIGGNLSGTMTFSEAIVPRIQTVTFTTGGNVVSSTSSGNDITNTSFLRIIASQIGTLANPVKIAASGLATDTSGSNGAQFLAEADSLLVTSLDLRAGTGTVTLTSGTILTDTNNDILGNVVVGTGATLGGSGIVTGNVSGAGTIAPGSSPGRLTINGNFMPTGTVAFEVDPPATTAGTNYDQIVVGGTVDLSGATLTFNGTTGAVAANQLLIPVLNNGSSAIVPNSTFPDGTTVTINGNNYRLFNSGGDGNDLVLVEASTPATVYVDDGFSGNPGQVIADADLGATGNQSAVFGLTAFNTVTEALAAVSSSGTVIVNSGSYSGTVSVDGTKTLRIGGTDAAQTVTISDLASVSGTQLVLAGTSNLTTGTTVDRTLAGTISGGGSITKLGSNIVILSSANTYAGLTTISAGVLRATVDGALGTTAAGVSVALGSTLDVRNVNYSTAEAVTLMGGTLMNSSGTSTFAGNVTLTADSNFTTSSSVLIQSGAILGSVRANKTGAGTLRLSNTGNTFSSFNIGGGTLQLGASGVIPDTADIIDSSTFDLNGFDETLDAFAGNGSIFNSQATVATLTFGGGNNSGDSRFNGAISGATNLIKIGTGRQTLGGVSSNYTGTTTINAGILAVTTENGGGAVQALGLASAGTTVNAGGILEFQFVNYALAEPITVNGGTIRATAGGNSPTFGSSSFGGPITLSTGTATFNLTTAATMTLNGVIDGDQALTKTGVGTLVLGNSNIYTGNTTVNAGTLIVNGSLASSSAVTVNTGGTLGGSGTINGPVTVASGGTVSPGTSPGVLDTGNVSFASGSTFVAEVNGTAAGSFDQLNVSGTVGLNNATLSLSGSITSSVNQQIVIINNDGQDSVTGTFNGLDEGAIVAINGVPFRITYQGGTDNNDVVLTEIANFNVALNSGNLSFTDLLGNISDNLTLSFDGPDYILTSSGQLLFTQIAGATGSGTGTVRVPATAVTGSSISLNGAGGADTLTISYGVSNFVDAVTLNGGAGNDVLRTIGTATAATAVTINGDADNDTINLNADLTFAANASMDFDLQDDSATPGADSINVGSNANMVLSGSGTAELTASSSIAFATGSSIATANGNLVVQTASLSLDGSIATSGASLTLIADSLTISTNGLIDGATNTVTIRPQSNGTAVDLGTDDSIGTLGLTVSELIRVTAGTLVIGGFTSGSVTISSDITRSISTSVQLMSGGSIIQNSADGSFNTAGGTLLLTPDNSGSHQPNRSGVDITASTVSYTSGSSVTIDISGKTVDSLYTQLNVSGTVGLANVELILTGSFTPAFGDSFVIVSATSVTGEFSNYADGSTFSFNGRTMRIDYTVTAVTLTDATAQAPVLSIPGSITYTENDAATAIASAVVVSDADNATLPSATVTVTNFVTGEDVLSFTNDGLTMGNIAVSTNIGGVLTLTSALSTATKAEWQAALRSVTYTNTSDNPTTTDRSVEFVISDGFLSSNTLTSTISITSVNDAPTTLTLTNTTPSLAESTSTATAIKVADISVTDDALGTNVLSLSGPDAAFFEIVGSELRLRAGTVLNFEVQAAYSVTVEVNDAAVGGAVDASQAFTLTITDINDAPTTLTLTNTTTSLPENTNTATAIKVADISVTDDALGTNVLSLSGTDAAFFEIVGSELRLKAGTVLDFETQSTYDVTVNVDDTGVGSTPDASAAFTLTLTNVLDTTSGPESFVLTFSAVDVTITQSINGGPAVSLGKFPLNAPIVLNGLAADDSVRIVGTSGDDTIAVSSAGIVVNGTTVTLTGPASRTLAGGAGNDTYSFDADDVLGRFTLEESGGGVDTITFASTTTTRVVLNLSIAVAQTVHPTNLQLILGSGSTFENATGGSGNDFLAGNALANTLIGNDGNDALFGGLGNDQLLGGRDNDIYHFVAATAGLEADTVTELAGGGTDTLSFASLTSDVLVNLATTAVQTVHPNRTLRLNSVSDFENAAGGSGNDTLVGNFANNVLTGNGGQDAFFGGRGDDTLIGGQGNDTYHFSPATGGPEADSVIELDNEGSDTLNFATITTDVTVALSLTTVQAVHTNRTLRLNSLSAFENANGGSGNDILVGNYAPNIFNGNNGNDAFYGGRGGDTLTGGRGNDTYHFSPATAGADSDTAIELPGGGFDTLSFSTITTNVTLNLSLNTIQTVHENRTLMLNAGDTFENATGGRGSDTLIGNALNNVLTGNGGHNQLSGLQGDDILVGSLGNDQLLGGAGRDILIGGAGLDTLDGGTEDDILIAGRPQPELSPASLLDLRTEWTSTTAYATRVANIRAGVGSSLTSLQAKVNVLDDAAVDTLTGGAGTDWYLRALDDVITDLFAGEIVDVL